MPPPGRFRRKLELVTSVVSELVPSGTRFIPLPLPLTVEWLNEMLRALLPSEKAPMPRPSPLPRLSLSSELVTISARELASAEPTAIAFWKCEMVESATDIVVELFPLDAARIASGQHRAPFSEQFTTASITEAV